MPSQVQQRNTWRKASLTADALGFCSHKPELVRPIIENDGSCSLKRLVKPGLRDESLLENVETWIALSWAFCIQEEGLDKTLCSCKS